MCMLPQPHKSAQPLQDSWLPKLTANRCANVTTIVSNQAVILKLKFTKTRDTLSKQPESSKPLNVKEIYRFTVYLEVILKFKKDQR